MKKLWVLLLSACIGLGTLVAQDINTLKQQAQKGDVDAQYNLAVRYIAGEGVSQDYAEAAKWYRRAADQGDAMAQSNLGWMYYNGEGVPQDYVQAYMWLSLDKPYSAWQEIQKNERINQTAKKMTPQQIAQAKKLARNWKPKKQ